MKDRKIKISILVIIIVLVICSALVVLFLKLKASNNTNKEDFNIGKIEENAINENNEEKTDNQTKKEPEYVDDNPIKVGLYIQKGNYKTLVKDEYYCNWDPEEILGLFYAVYTTDDIIAGNSFNTVWKEYLNNYSNIDKYRIGYNISFTMDDGEVIDQTILNPDHAYLMYPEIQFYLYDDINLIPGKRYYHVTHDDFNENTLCSSAKLVGDKRTPNIASDILLTAFTYDSEDDFEPETGKYRGNSYYTITIKRK